MSTAKRSRARQAEVGAAPSLPPSKKAKTSQQAGSGLAFLTDENQRAGKKLRANYTNGIKDSRADRVDESKAQVEQHEADAPEVVEISSGDESSVYSGSDDEADDTKPATNGHHDADAVMADADEDMEDGAEGQSFGDMLQAAHPETIDVQSAFADREEGTQALVPMNQDRSLALPTATSLGTVLTQALRTNDRDLLETCFQMTDLPSIRSTIQRLQSPLVASLLQRLAERLHKRPGRAGNLMVWVQWSLVSHGGYLASQPDVLKKLKTLSRVIKERANGLQSLVTLKGKLDMLNAQIELRKSVQEIRDGRFDDGDNVDDDVIYVEGQDDLSSDDEDDLISNAGDLSMVNGADQASSDVEEEEAGEGMFDEEAEETSDDEGEELSDEDEESDEVEEEEDDESSDDDEAPAPVVKPSRTQRAAGRRR
ncbi:NUC189-domain-containing protein [Aureobasidium sp. EXF-12298]|nr:NUC189-domain-containing protein [Aureobasidium sp. EXF-12298]KAI4758434.1 NUC189-domain-containing protein [Aureobasidium sp. EXF-12344]KAI4782711.1 NUC189-domain-containing protein [Aureobasidium sp. EXF-3400]